MGTGFFRKRALQAKAKRNARNWRLVWARPKLEALDSRVLPSVNATLNGQGILKVIADTHQGTQQVEIIQSQDQITVEDGGTEVNSFDITQVQQIDFKYREGQQQHAHINLDIPVNQAQMTLTGFSINEADLNIGNDALTATVAATLPDSTPVRLAGPVNADGTFDLAGFAGVIDVGNFPLILPHFDLTDQGMSLEAHTVLPVVGVTDFSGSLTPDGTYALTAPLQDFTVSGYTLTNASAALDNNGLVVTATTTVPVVGNVNLTGDLTVDGHYSLTASVPTVNVLGFTLNNVSVTIDDAHNLTLGAMATLPVVGDVTFAGTATPDGQYSLSASAGNFTVFGFTFSNVTATLNNNGLTVTADVTLPVTGHLTVSGSVTSAGQYSFTGTVANVSVLGFTLTNLTATVNNNGATVDAHATLPIINTVDLSGQVQSNGNYNLTVTVSNASFLGFTLRTVTATFTNSGMSFMIDATVPLVNTVHLSGQVQPNGTFSVAATVPSVTLLGFTLSPINVTLTNTSLSVMAHITNIPLVGTVDFNGQITPTSFSLSGTATNVDVAGFIHFSTIALTLNNSSLSLNATTNLPVVGNVTFTGVINSSGTFTISGTAPSFTVLGFVTFTNATVSLSFPNPTLTVSATINLPNIGNVSFSGTISAGGHFSFMAHASLTVAGFNLGDANLAITDAPASCITIGPFTTLPLPVIGRITFAGMYCSGGMFSFDVDVMPSPPLVIAGIPFNRFHVGLTNTSLTFGAGIGISMTGLNIASAYLQGTIHTNGDFSFLAQVSALSIAGFNAVSGTLTFSDTAGQYSLTLHATAQFLVANVVVDGSIDFNHSQFSVTGNATVGLAGFNAVTAHFVANNSGVTFSATINVIVATVNFSGSVDTHGNYRLTGSANVGFAGFGGSGSFTLTNSGLMFSGTVNVIVATINVAGSVSSTGAFSFMVNVRMNFAGFGASGSLTLDNIHGVMVTATLDLGVMGARMSFMGAVSFNGTYRFTATAGIHFGPVSASLGLTLSNTGFTAHLYAGVDVSANVGTDFWSVHVGFGGSLDVNFAIGTNGSYSASGDFVMTAYAGITLSLRIGFSVTNHQFTVRTGSIGFDIAGVHFAPFSDATFNY
jgi:hypothetical protein